MSKNNGDVTRTKKRQRQDDRDATNRNHQGDFAASATTNPPSDLSSTLSPRLEPVMGVLELQAAAS